jgi:LPXTG-motif cell wall-anchored protein
MIKRLFIAVLLTGAAVTAARADFTKTFIVTNSGATAYRFDGKPDNNPTLTLYRGHTYNFNYPAAHPFILDVTGLANAAATPLGAADGVTNAGTVLTYVVPASAPATVFYQCQIHDPMSGTIQIQDNPSVPALGKFGLIGLAALILGAGYIARRRRNQIG